MEAVERNWNAGPDALTNAILSTLSADAIRQGEGIESTVRLAVWNAAKKKGVSDEAAMATVEVVVAELPATPASHASDGERGHEQDGSTIFVRGRVGCLCEADLSEGR